MKKTLLLTFIAIGVLIFGPIASAQTYCAAGPSTTFDTEITNVVLLGDNFGISNLATCPGTTGVTNYTATDSADVSLGTSYTVQITFSTCGGVYGAAGQGWIDWNDDGDFLDAGESIGSWSGSPLPAGSTTYNGQFSFTVPATATLGQSRMRLMLYESGTLPLAPCATFTYGAVEDYKIVVTNTPPPCPIPGSLAAAPGSTSATISWASLGTSFDIEYGPVGFTLGTGTSAISTATSTVLTSLTSNTGYDVYVRNNCVGSGNGTSGWAGPVTFYTLCTTFSTPYTQNFGTWPPNCFTFSKTGSWDWDQDPAGYARARFWSFNSGSATMTSPPISITQEAQVKFKWAHQYNSSYPDDRVILRAQVVGTTQWDTLIDLVGPTFNSPNSGSTTPPPSVADFIPELFYLDSATYVGETAVFEFIAITDYGPHAYIDDFVVEDIPACPQPLAVTFSNVSSTTATVNFTSGGNSFPMEWGPVGFNQGTGASDTASASGHTISGLLPNTQYDFYILNDCTGAGNGLSVWAGPYTFRTLCVGVAEGYLENFDALATNTKNPCWYDFATGGGHTVYALAPSSFSNVQPFTTPNLYYWYNNNATMSHIVTPELIGLDGDTSQVRFRMTHNYFFATPAINVYVGTMSDRTDATTIVWADTINPAQYIWNEYTVLLTNVPTGHKFVVFGRSNNPTFSEVDLDNFNYEGIPQCPPPTSANAQATSSTSATVSWVGTGTSYTVEYGPTGFTQGTGLTTTVTSNSAMLTGLFANTCYDVYIQNDCGGGSVSPWFGPVVFCTPCAAVSMPYTEDFAIWPPNCMTFTKTGTWNWEAATGGHAVARFWSFSSGSATMASAPVSITQKAQVKFKWAHQFQTFYPDDRVVVRAHVLGSSQWDTLIDLVGPTFNSPNSGTTTPPPSISDFIPELFYLDSATYVGQTAVVEFVAYTDFGPNAFIDDLVIEAVPACPEPTQLTATLIQGYQATLNWSSAGGSQFVLEYGLSLLPI